MTSSFTAGHPVNISFKSGVQNDGRGFQLRYSFSQNYTDNRTITITNTVNDGFPDWGYAAVFVPVGVVLILIVVGLLLFCLYFKNRKTQKEPDYRQVLFNETVLEKLAEASLLFDEMGRKGLSSLANPQPRSGLRSLSSFCLSSPTWPLH